MATKKPKPAPEPEAEPADDGRLKSRRTRRQEETERA